MCARKHCLPSIMFTVVVLASQVAWALGERLGESKEQLNLDYEVTVVDHGTGRVTVTLTIRDRGRLNPLNSVYLVIPSEDSSGKVDLSLSLATREDDGKLSARVHLKRELAERAELQLRTLSLDGKTTPLTWYYHAIPVAKYLQADERPE